MQGQGGAPLTGGAAPEAPEGGAPEAPDGAAPEAPGQPGSRRRRRSVVVLAVAAVLVVAADVASKALVVAQLAHHAPVTLIPHVLDLELTRNSGAAFSVGTRATVLFTVVATVVAVVIARTAPRLVSSGWAAVLGLLLGGAVGNLIDRFARAPGPGRGEVVDWIHLHHWPVFNVADSAIVVGAVLAVVLSLRGVPATVPREDLEPRAGGDPSAPGPQG